MIELCIPSNEMKVQSNTCWHLLFDVETLFFHHQKVSRPIYGYKSVVNKSVKVKSRYEAVAMLTQLRIGSSIARQSPKHDREVLHVSRGTRKW